jgi:hyperosmotically inducible protein
MRHSRIFGALMLASVATVTMPPYASCDLIDDKAERNTRQAESEARKPGREATTAISDSWLTAKIKIELFADERIKFREISVETVNGTVRLRGTVDSEEARAAAISVASRVDGVRRVRSDLQVVRLERKTVHAIDREITQWVKADLSRDAGLNTVQARTDHRVVTLTGQVTDIGAGSRASEIAGGVPGVRSVKNELTYRSPRGNTDRSVLGALILFMSGKAPAR